jgi:repressor LexA
MSIAENIKKLREKHDLTQAELGQIAGVTDKAVWTWEQGGKNPRMGALEKIADHFGITTSSIIEGESKSNAVRINVYGTIPAGVPIEAIEDIVDWEEIPREMTAGGKEYFALRVKGDSMLPRYLDGDTIIILKQSDCESGQDAVVYVNGHDATLKKVVKKPQGILLQPLNHNYEPVLYYYDDPSHPVTICGAVVEIRRKI